MGEPSSGISIRPTQVVERERRSLLRRDLHALRYTYITDLIRNGANIKAAQELAGHKNISVTLDIYSQVFVCGRIAAMKKLSHGTASMQDEVVPQMSPGRKGSVA